MTMFPQFYEDLGPGPIAFMEWWKLARPDRHPDYTKSSLDEKITNIVERPSATTVAMTVTTNIPLADSIKLPSILVNTRANIPLEDSRSTVP